MIVDNNTKKSRALSPPSNYISLNTPPSISNPNRKKHNGVYTFNPSYEITYFVNKNTNMLDEDFKVNIK